MHSIRSSKSIFRFCFFSLDSKTHHGSKVDVKKRTEQRVDSTGGAVQSSSKETCCGLADGASNGRAHTSGCAETERMEKKIKRDRFFPQE